MEKKLIPVKFQRKRRDPEVRILIPQGNTLEEKKYSVEENRIAFLPKSYGRKKFFNEIFIDNF